MRPMPNFLHLNFSLPFLPPLSSKAELNWFLLYHLLLSLFTKVLSAGSHRCPCLDKGIFEPILYCLSPWPLCLCLVLLASCPPPSLLLLLPPPPPTSSPSSSSSSYLLLLLPPPPLPPSSIISSCIVLFFTQYSSKYH